MALKPFKRVASKGEVSRPEGCGTGDDDFYSLSRWADDGGRNISGYAPVAQMSQVQSPQARSPSGGEERCRFPGRIDIQP